MATKVGGFTKSGVVQCVKLVEESSSPNLDGFSGTIEQAHINFNNGYKLTFLDEILGQPLENAPEKSSFPSNVLDIYYETYDSSSSSFVSVFTSLVSSVDVYGTSILSEDYYNQESLSIYQIKFLLSTADPDYFNSTCCIKIETADGDIYYLQGFTGSSTTTVSVTVSTPIPIPYSIRFNVPTVRMGKDGTLKCKELIEEEVADNIDSFAPLQTSSSGSHTFILKNGTYIDLYENDTLVNVNTQGGIACIQSSTPVLSISFYPNQIGHTISPSQTEWDYNGSIDVLRISISFSAPPSNISNINRLTVNGTASYTKSSNTTSSISFTLDGNSNSWNIPYNERFKTPTVRIFKDGTIKCAEVEEATKEPNIEVWNGTKNNLRINCENGAVIYLMNGNNDSDLTFSIVERFIFNFAESTSSSQVAGELRLEMASNGSCSPTIYGPSSDYNDTSFYYETNPLVVQYIGLYCTNNSQLDSNFAINVKYDGSNHVYSFRSKTGNNIAIFYPNGPNDVLNFTDIPYLERVKYSWPGSTPSQPSTQNNFLTSDLGPLITSDGQEFIVQEGGGNS